MKGEKYGERKLPSDNCVGKKGMKKLDGNCAITIEERESVNKQSLINSSLEVYGKIISSWKLA